MIFLLFSPGNLLIILYKLTKIEAPSCYSFWNILITKFHYDPKKGHNSTKGDNPDFKKNTGQLFFYAESIYEISKPYLKLVMDGLTDARTDGQAQSNMPLKLFQSWGHKKKYSTLLSEDLFFTFTKSVDPDEMQHYD